MRHYCTLHDDLLSHCAVTENEIVFKPIVYLYVVVVRDLDSLILWSVIVSDCVA
jgi:hypothetical protein